jgi:hypothetical protein
MAIVVCSRDYEACAVVVDADAQMWSGSSPCVVASEEEHE